MVKTLNRPALKTLLFDFDGVLVESTEIKTRAFAELFAHESPDKIREIIDYHEKNGGVSRTEKFKFIHKVILKREFNDSMASNLAKRFSELVLEKVIEAPYTPGAKNFLDQYSGLYRSFVISGTPHTELEEIVARRQMKSYFSEIYGSPKRKSDIVRRLMDARKIEPETSVFIGDSLTDYEVAKEFKIHFIARIHEGNEVWLSGIDCVRCKDLVNLYALLPK